MEDWERAYSQKTSVLNRISRYSGFDFDEILNLPYSYYLLLSKESWIDSYLRTEGGSKILKDLWRLQQTEMDEKAVREYARREV